MLSYSIVLIASLDHPLAGREGVTPREAAKWPAIVPLEVSQGLRFHGTAACEFGVGVGAALEVGLRSAGPAPVVGTVAAPMSGYDVSWHGRKTPADMGIFALSPECATSSTPGLFASRFR